jgi:hypothetical protein
MNMYMCCGQAPAHLPATAAAFSHSPSGGSGGCAAAIANGGQPLPRGVMLQGAANGVSPAAVLFESDTAAASVPRAGGAEPDRRIREQQQNVGDSQRRASPRSPPRPPLPDPTIPDFPEAGASASDGLAAASAAAAAAVRGADDAAAPTSAPLLRPAATALPQQTPAPGGGFDALGAANGPAQQAAQPQPAADGPTPRSMADTQATTAALAEPAPAVDVIGSPSAVVAAAHPAAVETPPTVPTKVELPLPEPSLAAAAAEAGTATVSSQYISDPHALCHRHPDVMVSSWDILHCHH